MIGFGKFNYGCRDREAVWGIDRRREGGKGVHVRARARDPSIGEWRRQRAKTRVARGRYQAG